MRDQKKIESQRGVALLLVLIALTILTVMTADFMESNEVYLTTAVNQRDAVKAEYLAKSGVNLSRLLLSVQSLPTFKKALNFPFWKYADMMLEPFSSSDGSAGLMGDMMGFSLDGAQGLGLPENNEFSIEIIDEESKLNVNLGSNPTAASKVSNLDYLRMMVYPEMYDDLFTGGDYKDDMDREEVICEIYDFIDMDYDSCIGAAGEEDYYSSMEPPYERKNAPFDSLQELHLVRGIGDDFWSAIVEPNPEEPDTRVLTIWGNGKVNVNTAPPGVLIPILCQLAADADGNGPCMQYDMLINLANILQWHEMIKTFMPVTSSREFLQRLANPEQMLLMDAIPFPIGPNKGRDIFVTQSQVFSIYATGTVGNATKRIHAVIDIEPKQPDMIDPSQSVAAAGGKVLYWRVD